MNYSYNQDVWISNPVYDSVAIDDQFPNGWVLEFWDFAP